MVNACIVHHTQRRRTKLHVMNQIVMPMQLYCLMEAAKNVLQVQGSLIVKNVDRTRF